MGKADDAQWTEPFVQFDAGPNVTLKQAFGGKSVSYDGREVKITPDYQSSPALALARHPLDSATDHG